MSVPHVLLALLNRAPMHGYELKAAFEAELGALWTLNYGQLYPALERLETDGLVAKERVIQDDRPDKKVYSITEAGRAELHRWIEEEGSPPRLNREEFYFKLLAARGLSQDDLRLLIERQRQVCFRALGDWTRAKADLDPLREPVAVLLAESTILRLGADLKWLDEVERMAPVLCQGPGRA